MSNFKLKWSYDSAENAIKIINLFGAKAMDKINFYINNKKISSLNYYAFASCEADKKAKKEIRKFFKQNCFKNDFVEFIRN